MEKNNEGDVEIESFVECFLYAVDILKDKIFDCKEYIKKL